MKRVLAIALLLGACTDETADTIDVEGRSYVDHRDLPATGIPQIDLLLVVDDTTAMTSYQDRLAMIPQLLEQAFPLPGAGIADLRFAVTTDGTLRTGASGAFLTLTPEFDLTRVANFTGTLRESLGALMDVGTSSVASPQPLAVLARVLADNPQGFARPNAYLAIVIISARDDTSPGTINEYVQLARSTKSEPSNIAIAGLFASPAPRLDEFVASFPNRGRAVSIADGDMSTLFGQFGQLLRSTFGLPCSTASDVDPEAPGPQYDCTVTVTIRDHDRLVPPCRVEGDLFCWTIRHDPLCTAHDAVVMDHPPWGHSLFRPRMRTECVVVR